MAVAHLADVVRIVILRAHRGAAHPLRTFEPGLAEGFFEREPQVLRAGFGEHIATVVASGGHFVECIAGAHVHDVQGHVAGHVAEHDGAVGGLGLERRRAGVAVIAGVGFATGKCLLHQHVDGNAVLGVHHDDRATFGSGLHRLQDLAVVAVEHAGVSHEQLEAADALVLGEVLHRLQRFVVDTTDDLVEGVVDGAFAVGLAVPFGEAVEHVLAVTLHGHVDDGGDTAPGSRAATSFEGVAREGAAKGQLHVRVHIDTAGDDVLAAGVDDAVHALVGEIARCAECRDRLTVDEHVLGDHPGGRDDLAVLDQDLCHGSPSG